MRPEGEEREDKKLRTDESSKEGRSSGRIREDGEREEM